MYKGVTPTKFLLIYPSSNLFFIQPPTLESKKRTAIFVKLALISV